MASQGDPLSDVRHPRRYSTDSGCFAKTPVRERFPPLRAPAGGRWLCSSGSNDGRVMKSKKRCGKDRPRCKSCPGVCKRLGKLGYAEREDRRTCQLIVIPPKKVLKAARA